jgi:hypothetical protein
MDGTTDITEAIQTVIKFPKKVYFSDMAYFVLQVSPPSGNGIS